MSIYLRNNIHVTMDSIPDILASFEYAACGLVTTEANGTIRRANATFCKWLGFDADELIKKRKIQELLTVGGRFFHHTYWAPLLQMHGSAAEVQMDLVGHDGKILPMLINVTRQQHDDTSFDHLAFFVATDRKNSAREIISTRKSAQESLVSLHEAQQELQKNRDYLSIAIRSARMGVWSEDLNSRQVWWSPELEQLTGLTEKEFGSTAEAFYQLIHRDDRVFFMNEIQDAIQTKSQFNIQFRLQHISGRWLAIECRGHAVYSERGEALSIFGVVIDISDRKVAEEQLRELYLQLSVTDRRKDEFLATLAHELRNPLAPVSNVLEIMRLKETNDPFLRWSRDIIQRHVAQMTHLIDDLTESSRITQGRLQLRIKQIDITDVIQQAIEISYALMKESKHTFTVTNPETPIIIYADSTRIIQIISNLLINAAKYTPEGGAIFLNTFQDGDEAVLSVRDSGIGIPPEHLSTIFNMFSQLAPAIERSHGGLGIGLTLARGLVELHGGTIVALSEGNGKGSEFIVRLPIFNSPMAIAPIEQVITSAIMSKRILVIDDNIDAANSMALFLELKGHTTGTANNGITGIAMAENFSPEVILLDIGLPDINGYEVARRIRQQAWGKKIVLIATTGWGQNKDKELARDAGFDNHLTKPINFQDLHFLLQNTSAEKC
ncbi:MAG: ATP-binding protein [Pseudomonadota bacterium]